MNLDKVEHAVMDAARRQAEQILTAARNAANERVARETESLRRDAEHRIQVETRGIEDALARKLIQVKGAANKQLLEQRNAKLRALFGQVREGILAWPADRYAAAMRRALEEVAGPGPARVRVHASDRGAFEAILAAVNSARAENVALCLDADPLETRGGFVLVTDAYEVDQTLDAVLAVLERELAPEIAQALFAE